MASAYDEEDVDFWTHDESGLQNIRDNEGVLIEACVQHHRRLPAWNKIGGAKGPRPRATPGMYRMLELAAGLNDSLLLARKTIRGLAEDPTVTAHESALRAGRIRTIMKYYGKDVDSAGILRALSSLAAEIKDLDPTFADTVSRMNAGGYYKLPAPSFPLLKAVLGVGTLLLRRSDGKPRDRPMTRASPA